MDDDLKGYPERCRQCRGCIECSEEYCIFNAHGEPEECFMEKCSYCALFLRVQRLFLGNVG